MDRLEFGFGFEFGVADGLEAGVGVSASVGDGQGAQGAGGDAEEDVEALLREILAEPRQGESETEVVGGAVEGESGVVCEEGGQQAVVGAGNDVEGQLAEDTAKWTAEIEMQRMFDGMAAGMDVDFGSLASMDMGDVYAMGLEFGDVGVF